MNAFPMILDGSKFSWRADSAGADALGRVADHPGFPTSGRAPKQVAVRSHKTGGIVVFNFVDIAVDDGGGVALNYGATLPDGRHCDLSLWAD